MIKHIVDKLGYIRSALAVGLGIPLLIGANAFAQDATPAAVPDAPVAASTAAPAQTQTEAGAPTAERIIVTGSYIPTAESESALPVTVYTAETITKQGAQTVVEGLRQLPSFVGNAMTENDSNGGDGSAAVNLRALGQNNTLTLINGRRAFLGDALNAGSDVNLIGLGSISRSEILKDGASSIYGADAVAGVVNFIMIDGPNEAPYQGAELFTLYGNTTDGDAHVRQVYLRGGITGLDGKVAIAAAAEYYSRATIQSANRTIATTGDLSNDSTGLGLGGLNNNSPTFAGRVNVLDPATGIATKYVLTDLTNNAPMGLADYRPFDVPAGTDPSRFNFRSVTPAIPGQERFDYYVTGSYKVFGDGLQLYGNVMYTHLTQDNGLAGAPFTINAFTGSIAFPNDFDPVMALMTGDLPLVQQSQFNPFGDNLTEVRYRLQQDLGTGAPSSRKISFAMRLGRRVTLTSPITPSSATWDTIPGSFTADSTRKISTAATPLRLASTMRSWAAILISSSAKMRRSEAQPRSTIIPIRPRPTSRMASRSGPLPTITRRRPHAPPSSRTRASLNAIIWRT